MSALVLHWPQLSSCRHSPFRRWHVHVPHRNGWLVAEESENFMLFHSVICLKHDDRTEYVPLVAKPEHIFDSGHAPSDMNFGCKWSMRNLLNGSKAHIGRGKRGSVNGALHNPTKRLQKSSCSPSSANILPLRGRFAAPCGERYPSWGEARRERLQVSTKSAKKDAARRGGSGTQGAVAQFSTGRRCGNWQCCTVDWAAVAFAAAPLFKRGVA